jgi:hypothetical protein
MKLDPRHGLIPVERLDGLYARQGIDHSAGHLIERLLCGESARSHMHTGLIGTTLAILRRKELNCDNLV